MPALAKRPTTKTNGTAGKLPDVRPADDRPVVYPEITVCGVPIPRERMRLSFAAIKTVLGAETEPEYKARCEKSDDQTERAKGIIGFADEYLFLDTAGNKVRCWNNLDNRPYDPQTWEKYAQDLLNGEWAGFTMKGNTTVTLPLAGPDGRPSGKTVEVPLFTPNGETVIIGLTKRVESGQHRLVGGYLAAERWRANPKAYPHWAEEPYLESLVVCGVSESPRVVATLDNVRQRQLSDTIATSEVFRVDEKGKPRGQKERKELSRMLDAAVDLLWHRTGAGVADDPSRKFQTHATSWEFLARHDRLKLAVRHVFKLNYPARNVSDLRVSAGQCAAALYLMGSGTSDPAAYLKTRDESGLKWDLYKKAEAFFAALAKGEDRWARVTAEALGALHSVGAGEGLGGRMVEKLAVLAAAWKRFRNDQPVRPGDLKLTYGVNGSGNTVLLDPPTFGGIDQGDDPTGPEKESAADVERRKAKAQAAKVGRTIDAVQGSAADVRTGPAKSAAELVESVRADHANAVLFFRDPAGDYNVYGEDADTLGRELKTDVRKGVGGVPLVVIPSHHFEVTVRQLLESGYNLKTVALTDGQPTVTDVRPRQKSAPVQPGGAKPNGSEVPAIKPAPSGTPVRKTPPTPGGKKKPPLRGGTN